MSVSGFTFLRNARLNGYPFLESIRSLLPIVDEMVVAVGESEDDTLDMVLSITDPKIRIIQTRWNESMRDRGFVYGQQKMIAQYNCQSDWAFYLEADEVLHEKDYRVIQDNLKLYENDPSVEALYFDFLHFYGTPHQVGIAGYRRAPRIIKNSIRTIAPDGLFWVVLDRNKKGRYPRAKPAGGQIFHYGHCRKVSKMASKLNQVGRYWGASHPKFLGYGSIDSAEIVPFNKTHPSIMDYWLKNEAEIEFVYDPSYKPSLRDYKNRLRFWLERMFSLELSKKHYIEV